jgi:hypothetical protein
MNSTQTVENCRVSGCRGLATSGLTWHISVQLPSSSRIRVALTHFSHIVSKATAVFDAFSQFNRVKLKYYESIVFLALSLHVLLTKSIVQVWSQLVKISLKWFLCIKRKTMVGLHRSSKRSVELMLRTLVISCICFSSIYGKVPKYSPLIHSILTAKFGGL